MLADLFTYLSRSTFVVLTTPVGVQIRLPHCPQRLLAEPAMRNRVDV